MTVKDMSPSSRRRQAFRSMTQRFDYLNKKIEERKASGLSYSYLEDERDAIQWFMGEYRILADYHDRE